jgi:hypothetical protein
VSDIDAINKIEILAEMDKLAEEAGDWKNHLPYEALVEFDVRADVRETYGEDTTMCKCCQELISLFS